jgi:RimJ/RimL family protein N-acetyltransferase
VIDLPPEAALIANTPRLRLVPVRPEDAEEMFTVLNDQRLHRYIGGLPPSAAELAERYRGMESRRSADGTEVYLTWVVRLVPLGEAIGEVGGAVTDDGRATIGYTIGHRYQRHGFATEAVLAMVRLLTSHVDVSTVEAVIPPSHAAAQRVAEGLGMRSEGQSAAGWERWVGKTSVAFELAEQRSAAAAGRRPRRARRSTPAGTSPVAESGRKRAASGVAAGRRHSPTGSREGSPSGRG